MLLSFLLLVVVVSGKPLSEGEPQICVDKSPGCVTEMDLCHSPMWGQEMRRICAKTCGFCRAEVATTTTTTPPSPTTSKPHQEPQQQQQQQQQTFIILLFQPDRVVEHFFRWIFSFDQFPNFIRIPFYNTEQVSDAVVEQYSGQQGELTAVQNSVPAQRPEASDADHESKGMPVSGHENARIFTRPKENSAERKSE